jgi:hypothetical protein
MVASAVLHWLCSQSIFVVNIQESGSGPPPTDRASQSLTVGYSPIALLTTVIFALCTLLLNLLLGLKHLSSAMPIAGTCSLAIAAACHPDTDAGEEMAKKELKWGAVRGLNNRGVGHCTFTSDDVEYPVAGTLYA